ncbi:hypothetical protein [uncultured Croceitalea sp.]|uniref:hypothetical protein n=1 Tax=uncultured Croceitalea sp. TaxID=1798908 RepID=UPI0033068D2C
MKKLVVVAVFALVSFNLSAQDGGQTDKGSWLLEANTGFGGPGGRSANTSFRLTTIDGDVTYNLGFEGGYFIMDDLALKVGLGYGDGDNQPSTFSYKIGAKYYVIGRVPFQLDLAGASIEDFDNNPLWLGLQGGYAFFLGDNVSIEPGLRYNLNLNDDFIDSDVFQLNVGFVVHL